MIIKNGFSLRQSGEKFEIIRESDGGAVITDMNKTEVFLWGKIKGEFTEKTLVAEILMNFNVDGATAELEATGFMAMLKEADII